jgi:serine/threonine-protein kinase
MGSIAPGHILAGRYRLMAPLGRGAMGEVWQAEHVVLRTPLAVKMIIDAGFAEDNPQREELVARFFREAQAAAALRSPHVVQILDHGVDGVPYIAMELLEGETLEQRLERHGVLPYHQTAEIMTHVARAISKAHEVGIVHRDLKPGNVFIVKNDDEEVAKVLDFGIAKVTPVAGLEEGANVATRTGSLVGTPCYMSPEQALGHKTIDHRSDLWSLAVIAFECVVGKRPFDSEALGDLIVAICARPIPVPSKLGRVPEGFDAWWAKASCREVEGRFQSAKELTEALRAVLAPETISYRARLTQPSTPSILITLSPSESNAMAAMSAPDALAKTHHQATHAGVVSAVVGPSQRSRKRSIAIAVASFGLTVGVVAAVLIVRGGSSPEDPSAASPGTSAPGAPGVGVVPSPAIPEATSTAGAQAAPDPAGAGGPSGPSITPSPNSTEKPAAGQAEAAPGGSVKAAPTAAPKYVRPAKPVPTKTDRLGF